MMESHNHETNNNTDPETPTIKPFILVVEDDPVNLRVISRVLDHFHFQGCYETATDAYKALELFKNSFDDNMSHYRLVISDIGLPGMCGLELATEIKKLQTFGTSLVALSGYAALKEEKQKMLEAGYNYVISKPYHPDPVSDTVAQALLEAVAECEEKLRQEKQLLEGKNLKLK